MSDVNANVCLACGWRNDTNPDPDRDECPECGATFNNEYVERLFTKQLTEEDESTSFHAADGLTDEDLDDMDTVDVSELTSLAEPDA